MHYYNDGSDGFVWDPLWRKRTGLTPCEQQVVTHLAVRRLRETARHGAAARILPLIDTRFTHALGVFTLAAHFRPEDWYLRLAALLHEVGCLPFGEAAERALGADRGALTARVLAESGLSQVLAAHGFDPGRVLALILGAEPGPLACGPDGLSLDDLDGWLRDTEAAAMGQTPAQFLLEKLSLAGPFVETTDPATAREVLRRMAADLRVLLKPRCLAVAALAGEIFARAGLAAEELLALGDAEALLRASVNAPGLVGRLRYRPWSAAIRPDDGGPGVAVTVTALPGGEIRLGGRPVSEALPEAAAVYGALAKLKQNYKVTFP